MELATFQFELITLEELRLPKYKGSAFRGLFGHALRKTVCVTNMLDCAGCMLRQNCAYAYLFETFNDRNEKVAHPFIIIPPLNERQLFPEGDILKMEITLMGRAIEYLPFIIYTFREMGKRGLGFSRGRFRVQAVYANYNGNRKLVYNHEKQIIHTDFSRLNLFDLTAREIREAELEFITPTAIKVNGKVTLHMDFSLLIRNIIRRLKALSYFHNGSVGDLLDIDFNQAGAVETSAEDLRPFYWERMSTRQQKKIGFLGMVGRIRFRGDITPFSHLLQMGEWVHIGRGTVYGMGMYRMTN